MHSVTAEWHLEIQYKGSTHAGTGVGLDDPCRSFPTQDILCFHDSTVLRWDFPGTLPWHDQRESAILHQYGIAGVCQTADDFFAAIHRHYVQCISDTQTLPTYRLGLSTEVLSFENYVPAWEFWQMGDTEGKINTWSYGDINIFLSRVVNLDM